MEIYINIYIYFLKGNLRKMERDVRKTASESERKINEL